MAEKYLMRDHIEDYCDSLDAAVFSGDQFMEVEARTRLRWFMARWEKELQSWDRIDSQFDTAAEPK